MINMIFTSHTRFLKKKSPTNARPTREGWHLTKTVAFNEEYTQQPLRNQPPKLNTDSYLHNNTVERKSPERLSLIHPTELAPITDYITPPPPPQSRKLLSGPMVRTLAGTAKKSCCGGAV